MPFVVSDNNPYSYRLCVNKSSPISINLIPKLGWGYPLHYIAKRRVFEIGSYKGTKLIKELFLIIEKVKVIAKMKKKKKKN